MTSCHLTAKWRGSLERRQRLWQERTILPQSGAWFSLALVTARAFESQGTVESQSHFAKAANVQVEGAELRKSISVCFSGRRSKTKRCDDRHSNWCLRVSAATYLIVRFQVTRQILAIARIAKREQLGLTTLG